VLYNGNLNPLLPPFDRLYKGGSQLDPCVTTGHGRCYDYERGALFDGVRWGGCLAVCGSSRLVTLNEDGQHVALARTEHSQTVVASARVHTQTIYRVNRRNNPLQFLYGRIYYIRRDRVSMPSHNWISLADYSMPPRLADLVHHWAHYPTEYLGPVKEL